MGHVEIVGTYEDLPASEAFDIFLNNDLDSIDDIEPVLGADIARAYETHIYFTQK